MATFRITVRTHPCRWVNSAAFKFFVSGKKGFAPAPDGWHMWIKN